MGCKMAPNHSPGFLAISQEAKKHIKETTVFDVKSRLDKGEKLIIVDVREESEFAQDHIPGSIHISKGVIERDIELKIPRAQLKSYSIAVAVLDLRCPRKTLFEWDTPM